MGTTSGPNDGSGAASRGDSSAERLVASGDLRYINLRVSAFVASENRHSLVVRKGRMRMGPLGTVHRVGGDLHPTQRTSLGGTAGGGEVFGNRVARSLPLRAAIA